MTTFGIATLGLTTFSIATLGIKGFYMTLSINDTQHNHALHYAECRADCLVLFTVMLSVAMLNVIMLIVEAPQKMTFNQQYPQTQ